MAAYISNIVIDAGADFNQIFNLEDSANCTFRFDQVTQPHQN